ncbi:kinesin-like protein [Trifolium pratense]|uniref:Kinesin-like protein n=1 Tax=Trifolium pratense TaxID=57577 RepID=A0A2K3MCJ0_TRIPR|nr:kinesin-like protein [Trifolium pratense]
MWYRVLVARYGEVAGRLAVGGRSDSSWWREVAKVRDGEGIVGGRSDSSWWREVAKVRDGEGIVGGGWFAESIVRRVGNRVDTFFWTDPWRDIGGGYSVRGSYDLLTTSDADDHGATMDLIWHKQVPLKVSILVWWLFRNRLLTKDNLVARNIIYSDARFCVTGCGEAKTANYLFLSFPVFAPFWSLVRSWIDISSPAPALIQDHFIQFTHSAGGLRARRSLLQLVLAVLNLCYVA